MIDDDLRQKIAELRQKSYSQTKIAKELSLSRATIGRVLNEGQGAKLTLDALFQIGQCRECGTVYPKPKFIPAFRCPFCKTGFSWCEPQFKPEGAE